MCSVWSLQESEQDGSAPCRPAIHRDRSGETLLRVLFRVVCRVSLRPPSLLLRFGRDPSKLQKGHIAPVEPKLLPGNHPAKAISVSELSRPNVSGVLVQTVPQTSKSDLKRLWTGSRLGRSFPSPCRSSPATSSSSQQCLHCLPASSLSLPTASDLWVSEHAWVWGPRVSPCCCCWKG